MGSRAESYIIMMLYLLLECIGLFVHVFGWIASEARCASHLLGWLGTLVSRDSFMS